MATQTETTHRSSRVRKAALWTIGAVALAITIAACASFGRAIGLEWSESRRFGVEMYRIGFAQGDLYWERRGYAGGPPTSTPTRLFHEQNRKAGWNPPPGYAYAAREFWSAWSWIPVATLALPAALLIYAERRYRRRLRVGLCTTCGYDLRGIGAGKAAGVCPECGTPQSAAFRGRS